MYCLRIFNCFSHSLPELQSNTADWSIDSLRTNIIAVPHSMDVEKLKKIKKAAQYYLASPNELLNKQQAIPLLRELNRITNRQFEIAKYHSSTKKIHDLMKMHFNEDVAEALWGKIKLKILYRETAVNSLGIKSEQIEHKCGIHQTRLHQLWIILNSCRSAYFQKLEQKFRPDLRQKSADEHLQEVWSIEKIKTLATSLYQMNTRQLEALMRAITQQQSIHQKRILNLTKRLDHCKKVHEVLMTNISTLTEMEKQLDNQFIDLTTIPLSQHGSFL